uniref:Uncharacterized protein n=1 Tax=Lactuca sativa TaxID=4236 RepID=A0A9R1WHC3_LACSA|nr:hypothetical protein LSAT_V11C200079880 [Lactuca sativa]
MGVLPQHCSLWPVVSIVGNLLSGIGFGFFSPLITTFEFIGTDHKDKCFHCFVDGCFSTLEGSCTVVRDFTNFCFHSYFSFMDDLSEEIPIGEKPVDIWFIKLSKLPKSLFIIPIAIMIDIPLITDIALWKSPYMLIIRWKRLLEDIIGREGLFLETVCVPFAGLAIEDSIKFAFAYIVVVVSLFDEYTNDLLYLREGSCFPRSIYRENVKAYDRLERRNSIDIKNKRKAQVGQDWFHNLFKSCEVNERILFRVGLIYVKDNEECVVKGKCKKLGIKLPAWSILQCLLASAKSESSGEGIVS